MICRPEYYLLVIVVVSVLILHGYCGTQCLNNCSCSKNRKTLKGRVNCTNVNTGVVSVRNHDVSVADFVDLSHLPNNVYILILRFNGITKIKENNFELTIMLEKLDLSRNEIKVIEDNSFIKLSKLRKLDLSRNNIAVLRREMFSGLQSLEKLLLSSNRIFYLTNTTFFELTSLKLINLEKNPLICDCHLSWLPVWAKINSIILSTKTVCMYPNSLKDVILRNVDSTPMHCDGSLEVPTFNLLPSEQQLVFEGDSIVLSCSVSNVPNIKMNWTLEDELDRNLTDKLGTDGIDIEVSHYVDYKDNLLFNLLSLQDLDDRHNGRWCCHAGYDAYRVETSICVRMVVVTSNTTYCPQVITSGRKGTYEWPRTISPNVLKSNCSSNTISVLNNQPSLVYHTCGDDGLWHDLDTSECSFVSQVTTVLQQFAEVNISEKSIEDLSVLTRANVLRNYTSEEINRLTDIDIYYISSTLEQYVAFLPKYGNQLTHILLDIIDEVMSLESDTFVSAQLQFKASSRLLNVVKTIPNLSRVKGNALVYQNDRVTVKHNVVSGDTKHALTCMAFNFDEEHVSSYLSSLNSNVNNKDLASTNRNINIQCNHIDITTYIQRSNQMKFFDLLLELPPSLFEDVKSPSVVQSGHILQLVMFDTDRLFRSSSDGIRVVSSVVAADIANVSFSGGNLKEPILIMLKVKSSYGQNEGYSNVTPAWWNFTARGNSSSWSTRGCEVKKNIKTHVLFTCNHMSYYALIQRVDVVNFMDAEDIVVDVDPLLNPAIYIGSFICTMCLMVTSFLYVAYHSVIKMPSKAIHSLVNTWISTILLVLLFTFCIRLTMYVRACQVVAITVNYVTMSVLMWIIISVSNVLTKLRKNEPVMSDDSEPEFDDISPKPKKPMIRFYLLGWGVPVLVCGISAAVNLNLPSGRKYCLLPFHQTVGSMLCPSGVFVLIIVIIIILVRVLVSSNEQGLLTQLDESRSSLPDDNIEAITAVESDENQNLNTNESESDVDTEYSYRQQTQFQAVFLTLYLLSWCSAAAYIIDPAIGIFDPYQDIVFSGSYCFFATVLGLYVLVVYCYYRDDVRVCMCNMLHVGKNQLGSQQQSDITITTTITQNDVTRNGNVKDGATSPTISDIVQINPLIPCTSDTLDGKASLRRINKHNSNIFPPIVTVNPSSPRSQLSNSHAGFLNRDSSNSASSVAMTERSRQTHNTFKSMNGIGRSYSPLTATSAFVHPAATMSEVNFFNPHQQNVARKFFLKQRRRRERLGLCSKVCQSENSSRAADVSFDTSIDTSLSIPKHSERVSPVRHADQKDAKPISANGFLLPKSNGLQQDNLKRSIHAATNGYIPNAVLPPTNDASTTHDDVSLLETTRSCASPASIISLSRRSCQSETLVNQKPKYRRKRRQRDARSSIISNGTNSYPLRRSGDKENNRSKNRLRRSVSAYEQVINNNYNSSSSDDCDRTTHTGKHKNRSKRRSAQSLKKETSV